MLIKPTVGRVVWYQPNGAEIPDFTFHGSQPCAAQIAYVWTDTMINLSVTDHAGKQHAVTSVPLRHENDTAMPPRHGCHYCEWMPYQVGQAKAQA